MKVRATLPERYAIALLAGLISSVSMFLIPGLLLVGALLWGEINGMAIVATGCTALIGLLSSVVLGILARHDRELFKNPYGAIE